LLYFSEVKFRNQFYHNNNTVLTLWLSLNFLLINQEALNVLSVVKQCFGFVKGSRNALNYIKNSLHDCNLSKFKNLT